MSNNHSSNSLVKLIEYETHNYEITGTTIARAHDPEPILDELLQAPLCYFKRSMGSFDMYVTVVLKGLQEIREHTLELIGETYFLKLYFWGEATPEKKVIFMKFNDVPKPVGYKIPSVSVEIIPGPPTGEGLKTTTVDYEDADEDMAVYARNAAARAQHST
jgi:hypothetical protein